MTDEFILKPVLDMTLLSKAGSNDIKKIFLMFLDMQIYSLELENGSCKVTNFGLGNHMEILDAERKKGFMNHSFVGDALYLQNEEVRDLYITLWTKATHTEGYDKQEWKKLGSILEERGYFKF
jgi:hypothetical protein